MTEFNETFEYIDFLDTIDDDLITIEFNNDEILDFDMLCTGIVSELDENYLWDELENVNFITDNNTINECSSDIKSECTVSDTTNESNNEVEFVSISPSDNNIQMNSNKNTNNKNTNKLKNKSIRTSHADKVIWSNTNKRRIDSHRDLIQNQLRVARRVCKQFVNFLMNMILIHIQILYLIILQMILY